MDFDQIVDRYMEQERMYSLEGSRGVKHIAQLVNALGYSDLSRYGQQPGGHCLGDIFAFLEDNSGACEALVTWIKKQKSPEWAESIKERMEPNDDEDLVRNHFKDCPDCGHEIPDDAVRGEECENCGHVFNWGPTDDSPGWVDEATSS